MERKNTIIGKLKEIVSELSGYDPSELIESSSFLEQGFDSLFLTMLSGAFQKEFGVKITFRQLFDEFPTIDALALYLDAHLPAEAFAPEPVQEEPPMPLPSPATTSLDLSSTTSFCAEVATNKTSNTDGLQAIFTEQLKLMSAQLAMLGQSHAATSPTPILEPPAPSLKPEAPKVTPDRESDDREDEKPKLPPGFGPQVSAPGSGPKLTEKQKNHLNTLISQYNKKTASSKKLAQVYRETHADPRTAAGFNSLWKEMVYPIVVNKSLGSKLWDVDGNEYIDLLNGFGPNFLGHSPPFITEALHKQLDRGIEIGPQTPMAGEVSKLISEFTGLDRVTFVNTGSEAVQAAIRVSRTVTGKDKIVVFDKDYHGNFDEVLVKGLRVRSKPKTLPLAPGIPMEAVEKIIVLEYGSDEALKIIEQESANIAAVLVEPMQSRRPELQPKEFILKLRKLTEETDIVLVFDEVITGFRIRPGGAQEFYGIQADLATYGKVIGGGMPIGVVAGKAKFMDTFDGGMWQYGDTSFPGAGVTFFAGTFVRHPMAIAAAHATLTYMKQEGPALQQRVNEKTEKFVNRINNLFRENELNIFMAHFASQTYIRVQEENELATLLFYHLRKKGIHLLEGFPTYITDAHTEEDLDVVVDAFQASIEEMQDGGIFHIPSWKRNVEFPLTEPQHEIWMVSQMGDKASCAYNESDTLRIEGPLEIKVLQEAVQTVIARHQALNLVFDADGATQRNILGNKIEVPLTDLSDFVDEEKDQKVQEIIQQEASHPFDLEKGPLIRVQIVKLEEELHLFLIYGHHIVFDGWSSDVVLREIAEIYSARCLNKDYTLNQVTPFSEYVSEQEELFTSARGEEDLNYWLDHLKGVHPFLTLPTDNPRPQTKTYSGGTVHRVLGPEIWSSVKMAAKREGVSLYTLLFAAYNVLLSRLSGQEDIVIGIPIAGQSNTNYDALVGYCVNLLPVRSQLFGDKSFRDYLNEVRLNILDAYDHQVCSISKIIRNLSYNREQNRTPLVDVIFNYSTFFADIEMHGVTVSSLENKRQAVNFDLFLNIVEGGDSLIIDWDHNTDLISKETIGRWVGHMEVILNDIIENPEQKLDEISLLSKAEREKLLVQWNEN